MGSDYFEDILRQMYKKDDSYNPYSFRNKAIDDLIKSLSEEVEKCCDEIDQKQKHKPKFTDEEFNKTCEELGLVEDK